ncbi:MAG TPA: hypothetical protein VML19_28110 [Verrucomicrobiae bacterium]|nr:hypothetical protein [Verrucomicrobiae bacterium]
MAFQWLDMRIGEERDRRKREADILERLPRALNELRDLLRGCIAEYQNAFGPESAEVSGVLSRIRVTVRELRDGKWETAAKVEINVDNKLPGLQIDRAGKALQIEIGMLGGEKLSYRDVETDQYITTEDLTRRILDRVLFPKLPE